MSAAAHKGVAGFSSLDALCPVLPPNAPVLLALSGGADSRLLLELLLRHEPTHPLHLCHVHHGIRGVEADRDEQFCRALSERYGLPIHVCHGDVPAMVAATGMSPEEAARDLRYDCFARVMQKEHIPALITAHHADDNLETVLLRLCRGTGPQGLCGIPPLRPFPAAGEKAVILRPLLGLTRADILALCREMHLSFVTDATNADTTIPRNRLRAEVLPILREICPDVARHTRGACDRQRQMVIHLTIQTQEALQHIRNQDGSLCCSAVREQGDLAASLVRAYVRDLASDLCLSSAVTDALTALLCAGTGDARLNLGDGYLAVRSGDSLYIGKADDPTADPPPAPYELALTEGQTVCSPDRRVRASLFSCDAHHQNFPFPSQEIKNVYNPFIRDTLTVDIMIPCAPAEGLVLRPRQAGDRMWHHGVHRPVRKLQNQYGLVPALRERLPLLCDRAGDILWTPGVGFRDGMLDNTPRTGRLHLHIDIDPAAAGC